MSFHAAVSMVNTMFVIVGFLTTSYKVFEKFSKKFTTLKTSLKIPRLKGWCF